MFDTGEPAEDVVGEFLWPTYELVDKLYAIGVAAAHAGDAARTRRALVELSAALDHDRGGDVAASLGALYDWGIRATTEGDLGPVAEVLDGLRDAWRRAALAPDAPAPEPAAA